MLLIGPKVDPISRIESLREMTEGENDQRWLKYDYGFRNMTEREVQIYFTLTNRVSALLETDSESARSEESLYTELVILVQGDGDVADRLIEQQQRLFPKETRRKWIERARDKLLHDRGSFAL